MGHSSAKKKKKKGRGSAPSKDRSSQSADDQDLLSEELTALAAIFGDDIEVASESHHTQFVIINIRPRSNDMVDEDLNVSARLLILTWVSSQVPQDTNFTRERSIKGRSESTSLVAY